MLHFARWKILSILAICLLGLLLPIPSFLPEATYKKLPGWAQHRINLGLDLRGGAHLLFEMDTAEIKKNWLATLRQDALTKLREAKIRPSAVTLTGTVLTIKLPDAADTQRALKELAPMVQQIGAAVFTNTGADVEIQSPEPGTITIAPTEQGIQNKITSGIDAAIETVNRRINGLGTTESSIVRQGRDRILIQYPGLLETGPVKALVGTTAQLNFHDVHPDFTYDPARPLPPGFKAFESAESGRTQGQILLRAEPVVRGEELTGAYPQFDQRTQIPIISFKFNNAGARKFCKFTEENVNRPFAIVLDDKVISAPVINERICGGSGQISGGFTVESANTLAVQLRSGALPAKLTVVEERVVGASLGQDSIDAGKNAAIIAAILVAGFMIFAYGLFGVFATIGATLHVVLVIAIMALIGSTLTLPGIAGIVLTIGMAVDANVLIYERIREELRNGRTPIMAIETGFRMAYGTIFDSQLTTFIAGILMFWLGSGPVRGFAVTLTLGIMTTIFTAVTVTRLLVATWLKMQKRSAVPAPL